MSTPPVIDPLEAMLVLAQAHQPLTALVGDRIAAAHDFATQNKKTSWKTPSRAFVLRYDIGGQQDIHVADQCVRLAGECYGEDAADAGLVYTAIVSLFRIDERQVVDTSRGKALIYWVVPDGTPRTDRNPDVLVDFISVPLKVCVAERPVG